MGYLLYLILAAISLVMLDYSMYLSNQLLSCYIFQEHTMVSNVATGGKWRVTYAEIVWCSED